MSKSIKHVRNPNPFKQAQWFNLSRKKYYAPLVFNNSIISQTTSQKHLDIWLGARLNLMEHLKGVANKTQKTIGLLCKLPNILPRPALIVICNTFVRLHLDYCDTMISCVKKTDNNTFHEKIQSVLYNAFLTLTRATRRTWKEKVYQELGLESLQQRWWQRKLYTLYKNI